MSENYFDWLQRETPTRWWHDSGNPDEIALALQRHAMGVTTNPVLTYRTFNMQPEFWADKVAQISQDLDFEERAEALLKLVATYAAEQVRPIYEATNGEHGYALGQLNPGRAGDFEGMLGPQYRHQAPCHPLRYRGGGADRRRGHPHLRHAERLHLPGHRRGGGL